MYAFLATFAILLLASEARLLQQQSCPNTSWNFTKCSVPNQPVGISNAITPGGVARVSPLLAAVSTAGAVASSAAGPPSPPPPSPPPPSPPSIQTTKVAWEWPDAVPLPSRYAPRNSTNATNPFINPDLPLVRSAQGYVSGGTIGFSTGGAQDIENFRENINNGFLPLPTDVTFGGVVKDYYFDTTPTNGAQQPCTELFCPVYSAASTQDPLLVAAFQGPAPSKDLYLAVGLDSGLQASQAQRKPLNLVILVDYSGSMSSSFDEYYYDQFGNRQNLTQQDLSKSKMDIAKEVMTGIIDLLNPGDKVSIVAFDDAACIPLDLTPVSCLNKDQLKSDILRDVEADGGTNQEAGLDAAIGVLSNCSECLSAGLASVENRIIMITDQQPNTGDISKEGLGKMVRDAGAKDIFLTLIGVGLDLNTELVEALATSRGANYFSVHQPREFKERIVDEFDYAVTPLVFDLELAVDSASVNAGAGEGQGWRILSVYGSPNPNATADAPLGGNGTISRVNTLFPSPKSEQGIKGGVVLLRMQAPQGGPTAVPLNLQASYSDRQGKNYASKRLVSIPEPALTTGAGPFYQSTGVRKAVLLARYTDLVRNWLIDEWRQLNDTQGNRTVVVPANLCRVFPNEYCPDLATKDPYGVKQVSGGCDLGSWINPAACILPTPVPVVIELGQWERQSVNLTGHVDPGAKQAFKEFLPYMQEEITALGDQELQQEVDLLNTIIAA